MAGYRDYQPGLAPGWLQDPAGARWLQAFGEGKDWIADLADQAVKARMPGICPPDALPRIGDERQLDRGPGESEANYRARLVAARDTWQWAGTPYGLLLALYWAGYTPASGKVLLQVQLGKQYALRDDFDPALHAPEDALVVSDLGLPVHLGGSPAELWSDFAVLFTPPTPASWVTSPPADNSDEVERIRRLIRQWKPGHARCVSLKVTTVELWGFPIEQWDTTTELWGQSGITTSWTPPG